MPNERRCFVCGTVLATEKKRMALASKLRYRWDRVELCHSCWWVAIGKGFLEVVVVGEAYVVRVTVEQRDLFSDELRPGAEEEVPHG